jgi:hypothetical protein
MMREMVMHGNSVRCFCRSVQIGFAKRSVLEGCELPTAIRKSVLFDPGLRLGGRVAVIQAFAVLKRA